MSKAQICSHIDDQAGQTTFMGLASLLRLSLSGKSLAELGQQLIERASRDPGDACAMMDAATVLQFYGNRDLALLLQRQALQVQRHYCLKPARTPALRLLALMAPGDLMANVPVDCLLEGSDVELHLCYALPGVPLGPMPEHDVLFVAVGESNDNRRLLEELGETLKSWPKPVLNPPDLIHRVARDIACTLLRDVDNVLMPPTIRVDRQTLGRIASSACPMSSILPQYGFPVIVRPVGSHAGHDLERINTQDELEAYVSGVPSDHFFVSPYIDYSGDGGFFRKYRIALIQGKPFACHMGVSSHWMIHYLNAGMAESVDKRREEARFMENFDEDFARRHSAALRAIHEHIGLDYLCIDCGEMPDGHLLIFEVDHAMIVHAMDPEDLFAYKQPQMHKVFRAFREMLERTARRNAVAVSGPSNAAGAMR